MKHWLRRVRGALGMGVTWAIVWVIAGLCIGVASNLLPMLSWDWFFRVFDAPLPAMAMPGFIGGVFFALVLGVAGRRRRFHELSLPRFAAWGALGGVLLLLLPLVMMRLALATPSGTTADDPWRVVPVAGLFVVLSAASAAISLVLARRAERQEADLSLS